MKVKTIFHIFPTAVLMLLASARAQEVSIPDPGLNAAWTGLSFTTNGLGRVLFTDVTAHLASQKFTARVPRLDTEIVAFISTSL